MTRVGQIGGSGRVFRSGANLTATLLNVRPELLAYLTGRFGGSVQADNFIG